MSDHAPRSRPERGPDGRWTAGNRGSARKPVARGTLTLCELRTRNRIVNALRAAGRSLVLARARAGEFTTAQRVVADLSDVAPAQRVATYAMLRSAQAVVAAVLAESGLDEAAPPRKPADRQAATRAAEDLAVVREHFSGRTR